MDEAVLNIDRVTTGIATNVVTDRAKFLLSISTALGKKHNTALLPILHRVRAICAACSCRGVGRTYYYRSRSIGLIKLIRELPVPGIKPRHERHGFVGRAWHITSLKRAFKQGLIRIGLNLAEVVQVSSSNAVGIISWSAEHGKDFTRVRIGNDDRTF